MKQSAPERLARELPPDGVRTALERIKALRHRGEAGIAFIARIDGQGRLSIDVRFELRDEAARPPGQGSLRDGVHCRL